MLTVNLIASLEYYYKYNYNNWKHQWASWSPTEAADAMNPEAADAADRWTKRPLDIL